MILKQLQIPAVRFFLFIGLTFLVYYPAIHAGFVWDDDDYVTANRLLHTLDGLWRIWTTFETTQYYPLVFTTFWLEYQLWELHPMGYHINNILLHAFNAMLVGFLLQRLKVPGAWWIAMIFAIHPTHVESVAWVTERKNVLSGIFYLLALWAYLQFDSTRRHRWYALSLGLFVLALFSKTVTSTLPAIIGLVLLYQHRRLSLQDVFRLIPYFVLGLAMGLVTAWLERTQVGASGVDLASGVSADFSFLERLLIASQALWFYVGKLLVPYPIIFNYPRWEIPPSAWWDYWPVVVTLAFLAGLAVAWRKGYRNWVFPFLFYGITIFPALGFFNVFMFIYSFVADHFQYLASVGILIVFVQIEIVLFRWVAARTNQNLHRIGQYGFRVAVVGIFGLLTWQQASVYEDIETLWKDTLAKNPKSWLAYNNLGEYYLNNDRLDEAFELFNQALQYSRFLGAYSNRAVVYLQREQYDLALNDLNHVLNIAPHYADAAYNRGNVYAALGQYDQAIQDYSVALAENPELADAYHNRGNVYSTIEQYGPALKDYTAALQLQPDALAIYINRGRTYVAVGQFQAALQDYSTALQLSPDIPQAYNERGWIYMTQLQQPQLACSDWNNACRLGQCDFFQTAQQEGLCQ